MAGPGRVESVRVGSDRVGSGRVRGCANSLRSGWVGSPLPDPTRPDPRGLTRPRRQPRLERLRHRSHVESRRWYVKGLRVGITAHCRPRVYIAAWRFLGYVRRRGGLHLRDGDYFVPHVAKSVVQDTPCMVSRVLLVLPIARPCFVFFVFLLYETMPSFFVCFVVLGPRKGYRGEGWGGGLSVLKPRSVSV